MPAYKAPLRDIRFLINEVFDYSAHYKTLSIGENADPDTVNMILEGAADFCENVLSPLNQSGDEEGCHFKDGEVTTPKGFKEAYNQFVQGGWQGLSYPEEFGGQALPMSLNLIKSEMMGTANWSFTMYPGLSTGCMNTIMQYGTDEQKNTYMPHLTAGTWSGTMCLTEPQCGTDLGQVKTKAEPNSDGTYAITGTKIFISAGEHDLTENIIHIVLARLPDSPKGQVLKQIEVLKKKHHLEDDHQYDDELGNSIDTIVVGALKSKQSVLEIQNMLKKYKTTEAVFAQYYMQKFEAENDVENNQREEYQKTVKTLAKAYVAFKNNKFSDQIVANLNDNSIEFIDYDLFKQTYQTLSDAKLK